LHLTGTLSIWPYGAIDTNTGSLSIPGTLSFEHADVFQADDGLPSAEVKGTTSWASLPLDHSLLVLSQWHENKADVRKSLV